MPITIELLPDAAAKAALCLEIAAELPMWFGRPESNARYAAGMAGRDAFVALVDGQPQGLIALEYHFGTTCNIWWLGVRPASHGQGVGRREYDLTRRFYEAVGFTPFVGFEPEPGDYMMWMVRAL
jgi:GNAT superfamily N-acetyltransferase